MTSLTPRRLNLDRLKLGTGAHNPANLDNGMVDQGAACLFEAVAWMAGEPWTDTPECASPVLGEFGRCLNDVLPDDLRQQLVPLVPKLIGTRDGRDERRSYIALDWLIRTYTPTWLGLVPSLVEVANALVALPEITDLATARAAGKVVRSAADKAVAARVAAGAAARAAAWDAARVAAWDAAGAAAGAAARAAARDAAWDAAGAAAGAAAWAAAGAAARAAAWAALKSTVTKLQQSAIACFERMVDPS